MFRRILVPLDGSPRAEQALPVAARLAHASGGTIVLLRVVSIPYAFVAYVTLEPISTQITIDTVLEEARNYLKRTAEASSLIGIQVETNVILGQAAAAILSVVASHTIDLIVMHSHGYSGMMRWALGSVAEKVTHHAAAPVLLLREGGSAFARSHPHKGSLRVLVPIDGSPCAQTAIVPAAQFIAALSGSAQGMLHVTQVVTPFAPEQIGLQEAKQHINAIVESICEELVVSPVANLKLPITWSITFDDDVASGIIRVAENSEDAEGTGVFGGYDMIAMATHGRGALQRWLMGSITERVLHATKLPLLIVRPSNMADEPISTP